MFIRLICNLFSRSHCGGPGGAGDLGVKSQMCLWGEDLMRVCGHCERPVCSLGNVC